MAGDVSTVEQLPKSFSRTKAVATRELQEALSSAEVSLEEKEITLENGEVIRLPSMRIGRMQLFYGSQVPGITELTKSEETTLGNGLYLTSSRDAASGYAVVRASRKPNIPIVYETEIRDLNILNLSTPQSIDAFAKLMRQEILKLKTSDSGGDTQQAWRNIIVDTNLETIDQKKYRGLKDLTWNFQDRVPLMLSGLGYDGLMAFEGGETRNGVDIGVHDTFVISDLKKAKITNEQQIASLLPQNQG